MEDEDLHRTFTRDELEAIMAPGLQRLREVCEKALKDSGLKEDEIDCIELIGEGTRIPAVKTVGEQVFKKDKHQRTINSSEVVARGCSLMAAMILPHFHVAKFDLFECNNYPVDVSWSVSNNQMKTKTLFPLKCNYPSVKSLTFDGRSEPMDVGVSYHSMDGIMGGLPQLLARYRVEPPKPKEEKFSLKLRVQMDGNGIPALDTAELVEEYTEIKKIPIKKQAPPAPKPAEAPKEGEAPADASTTEENKEAPKEPEIQYEEQTVNKTRSTQIHFKWEQHGYGVQKITEFIEAEDSMCKQDNVILEIKVMRNHLETYVYDMRAALNIIGNYAPYIKEDDKEAYLLELNQVEEWIYSDGESAAKEIYESKWDELRKIGDPVKARYVFHDMFPPRAKDFEDTVNNYFQQAANIPDDSHITKEEREQLLKKCQDVIEWFNNSKDVQNSLPTYENPVIDFNEMETKKNEVITLGNKILNKPVPKKENKPEDAKAEEKTDAGQSAPAADNKDAEMKDN